MREAYQDFEGRDAEVSSYTDGSLEPLSSEAYINLCTAADITAKPDGALWVADLYERNDLFPVSTYKNITLQEHISLILDYRRAKQIQLDKPGTPTHHEFEWEKRLRDEKAILIWINRDKVREVCGSCGCSGFAGQYPFTTIDGSCDDCA